MSYLQIPYRISKNLLYKRLIRTESHSFKFLFDILYDFVIKTFLRKSECLTFLRKDLLILFGSDVKRNRPLRWIIQHFSYQAICSEKEGLEAANVGLCQVLSKSASSTH